MPRATILLALGAIATALSCCSPSSSAPDGGACAAYQVPSSFNPNSPQVTLRGDVLPIFRLSCGLSASCHQSPASTSGRIYLGSSMITDNSDAAKVHDGIVNTPSVDLPSMAVVKPNDPANSFLMHKIDGDQCTLDAQCVGKNCLLSMPQNSDLIEVARRDTVRRWIAQGAQNN
jgi:hypothetical protein